MSRLLKTYYAFFILTVLFACDKPPVNWSRSFDSADTIPYGTYIMREELGNIFPDSDIYDIKEKTSDYIFDLYLEDAEGCFMYIHDSTGRRDSVTWNYLLDYVQNGGTAFLSTSNLNEEFEQRLGVKVKTDSATIYNQVPVALSVDKGKKSRYIFEKGSRYSYISDFDEENTDLLGYISRDEKESKPNYAKIYYGNGQLLLHTQPVVFTNYHLLETDHFEYVTDVFSYLEDGDIYWDNLRLYRREFGGDEGGFFNFMDFVMKNDPLRWAVYLLLASALAYLLFNSKRRQRAVPVILPYSNYTLDFAQTLSEVYRNNPDHTAMVKYKINYFTEQLRAKYHITAKEMEKDFSEQLSAKSGVDLQSCKDLISALDTYKKKDYSNKEDFFKLQTLLDNFNKKSIQHGRTESR